MLAWTGTANPTLPQAQGSTVVPSTNPGEMYLWQPTIRLPAVQSGTGGDTTVYDSATRTATECFMVGLSERIEIQTDSSDPWRWRRVVFKYHGKDLMTHVSPTAGDLGAASLLTSNGYVRYTAQLSNTADVLTTTIQNQINGHIFRGVLNIDYDSVMNAKIDRETADVIYDKTRIIKSGNDSGTFYQTKLFHKFRSNLIYNDNEQGGNTGPDGYSASSLRSMGDVYVVDYFEPLNNLGNLRFWPNATLFWHER